MNKILSSLIGGALGDALGYSREFNNVKEITKFLPRGKNRWQRANFTNAPAARFSPDGKALISDDTQMTIATGRALVAAQQHIGPGTFAQDFERELPEFYISWSQHPDNNRAPGGACMAACAKLAAGFSWADATGINSMGCGANMRVAPIALFEAPGTPLINLAYLSAAMTHGHPAALAAAGLTVTAIQAAYNGMPGGEILDFLIRRCHPGQYEYPADVLGDLWEQSEYTSPKAYMRAGYEKCLLHLVDAKAALRLGWAGETDPCEITGEAWTAPEALAGAMLCTVGLWENPVQVLQRAAVSNGDSDSIAAIAGNIRGAAGVDWPEGWVSQLETGPVNELYKLAERL